MTTFDDPDRDVPERTDRFPTSQSIEDARTRLGPRTFWNDQPRNVHYDLCNGLDCPCLREGKLILAASHRDVLDHFCRVDPDFVRERLSLAQDAGAEGSTT